MKSESGSVGVSLFGAKQNLCVGACVLSRVAGWVSAALPPVPVPPANPITEPKRVLGKVLFWDEQLSTSNTVSCGTCHSFVRAGTDSRGPGRNPGADGILNTPDDMLGSLGVVRSNSSNNIERDGVFGVLAQVTSRAANSTINAAYAPQLFWDGRANGQFVDPQTGQVAIVAGGALESQSVQPVVNSVEMAHAGIDWNAVAAKLATVRPLDLATTIPADVQTALADKPTYAELFRRAFGDGAITARRIAFAIATYQRTLISDQTPFDSFRAGNTNALTAQQQQGLTRFQQVGCAICHSLNNDMTTDFSFRNIGLRPPAEDLGRQIVTGNPNDRGRFKVPNLRNVGLKQSFMHNGQFTTIQQVIDFYARVPGAAPQFPDNQDPAVRNIVLNGPDLAAVDAFIRTGLTDSRVANRTFPFDQPTLAVERPLNRSTSLGGGVAGSGGIVPRSVVLSPPMLGSLDHRIGLDGALGGATAQLGISLTAPVGGRITPTQYVGSVTAEGAGNGVGLATLHWPLNIGSFQPGQMVYAQWIVNDPAAPNGQALSDVIRLPIFCGSYGCCTPVSATVNAPAPSCKSASINLTVNHTALGEVTFQWWKGNDMLVNGNGVSGATGSTLTMSGALSRAGDYRCVVSGVCGGTTSNTVSVVVCASDFNCDGSVDFFDYLDFVADFAGQVPAADFNEDSVIDFFDYLDFVSGFSGGC
jgi:cytochrome c peroxidase